MEAKGQAAERSELSGEIVGGNEDRERWREALGSLPFPCPPHMGFRVGASWTCSKQEPPRAASAAAADSNSLPLLLEAVRLGGPSRPSQAAGPTLPQPESPFPNDGSAS